MERAEIERAIGEVARQHNLLLSPDDPLLVTITLNEVILQRIIARQLQAIEAAQDQIAAGSAPVVGASRENARRRRDGERTGASIAIGLVARVGGFFCCRTLAKHLSAQEHAAAPLLDGTA